MPHLIDHEPRIHPHDASLIESMEAMLGNLALLEQTALRLAFGDDSAFRFSPVDQLMPAEAPALPAADERGHVMARLVLAIAEAKQIAQLLYALEQVRVAQQSLDDPVH